MATDFALNTAPPSAETLKIAEEELRETPENVANGLKELRELLTKDGTLYFNQEDDAVLKMYLRPCKFYAQSAFDLMKRIAEFKIKHKNLLEGLKPDDVKDSIFSSDVVNVLKGTDDKGRRVLIVKCGSNWDPSKLSTDEIFRIFFIIHQAALLDEEIQVRGTVVIMDYDGLGLKQAKSFTPAYSLLLLSFIQEAMPLRLKEVHMVKQPFIFNMVWTIFKPFIKAKLSKRIHFHGSKMKDLHKFISPSHLPADYGGELPAIDYSAKEWYPFIKEHNDHFEMMGKFGKIKADA